MTLHKRKLLLSSTPTCFNRLLYVQVVVASAVVVVCLQVSAANATHKITNHVTSYSSFQHLNIPREIASIKHKHKHKHDDSSKLYSHHHHHDSHPKSIITLLSNENPNDSSNQSSSIIKLDVIHRDKLLISNNKQRPHMRRHDHKQRFSERIQRDAMRVSGLVGRLSLSNSNSSSGAGALSNDYKVVESFGSGVVSGMEQGSGEYFIRLSVGSPPRNQYVVIDSGSDIVWVQCQPCNHCYRQSDPVFNPVQSKSYSGVSCSSSVCGLLRKNSATGCTHPDSGSDSAPCRYEVLYSDGSYTKGNLALETLTIGGTVIRNVAMGCGHANQGMFVGAAGLLGLGGGSMSFVGQLGGQTGGAFSYCLLSRGSGSTGSLVFGREAMPVGAAWTNLVRSPRGPSFYYVGLSGLGVGGVRVLLPDGVFGMTDSGDGGVVMDTGTAVTRFPTAAYQAFRDSFLTQTANLPRASGESIFDTCYNLAGYGSVRVPTISFYFTDGPTLTLPARNFLIPTDEAGTFCFAFAPSPSGLSIIGNIQQEGIQISIDGANGHLGFGPDVC